MALGTLAGVLGIDAEAHLPKETYGREKGHRPQFAVRACVLEKNMRAMTRKHTHASSQKRECAPRCAYWISAPEEEKASYPFGKQERQATAERGRGFQGRKKRFTRERLRSFSESEL